jgi:hypothetical protein
MAPKIISKLSGLFSRSSALWLPVFMIFNTALLLSAFLISRTAF